MFSIYFDFRSCVLCIALLSSALISAAQHKVETHGFLSKSLVSTSPTTSSLGMFSQTPVDLHTGTPNIAIPLHTVSYKDINIPITLQYHQAMGNKPDILPGHTGLGWLLKAGGVVTRISRSVTPADFPDPETVPVLFNPTESSTWSSATTMQNHLKSQTVFVNSNGRYDEFSFNFMGISGTIYKDHTDALRVRCKNGEEMLVSILYYNTKGFWMPLEPQTLTGNLRVNAPYEPGVEQKYVPYSITLTDSKGIMYVFGAYDDAIEFSRPGMNYSTFDLDDKNTIATSWYLTSILSPNGYRIDLSYTRGKFYISSEIGVSNTFVSPASWTNNEYPKAKVIKSTLYHPCYLDKITTPTSIVQFNWSSATSQLSYPFTVSNNVTSTIPDDISSQIYFCKYPQIKEADVNNRFPDKLDNFVISTNTGIRRKSCEFTYTNNVNTRLKLLSLKIKGQNTSAENIPTYTFEYNTTPLPPYFSFKTDLYGYYNGRNLYMTEPVNSSYYYSFFNDPTNRQNYINSRSVDESYITAEILRKIVYPTGGSTVFEFESNRYGSIAKFWPASLVNTTGNGGGLRIKRITDYDYGTHITRDLSYKYVKNYATAGTVSSGVLDYEPEFHAYFNGPVTAPQKFVGTSGASHYAGTMTYYQYGSDPINPASYFKGSPVSYSEVAEVHPDNSFTVYKFKNYDNGYHDRPAESQVSDNANITSFWKEDDMNDLDLERGQLLSEDIFNISGILKKSTSYQYSDAASRFDQHVRRIKFNTNPIFSPNYPSIRYTANLVYTYYPFLKSSTVTTHENGQTLTQTQNFTYNEPRRLLTSTSSTGSDNITTTETLKYPIDFPVDPILTEMASNLRHRIGHVIERSVTKGTTAVSTTKTNFYKPYAGIYVPLNQQEQIGTNPVETRLLFNAYAANGDIQEQQKSDDIKEAYFWGYNGQYLVAKVVGGSYAAASGFINPSILNNVSTTDAAMRTELNKLRTNLPNAQVTTYTYSPLVGMSSMTDPRGKTNYYEYDHMGRLALVKDQDLNIVKQICYDYANMPTSCPPFYNSDQTGTYTRNNCPVGQTPGRVVVNIHEGMFTSAISVEDANLQAENYGQQQANELASCYPPCGVFVTATFDATIADFNTDGIQTSFAMFLRSNQIMVANTNYVVGNVFAACRPQLPLLGSSVTENELGRTWLITIANDGTITVRITSGSNFPANNVVSLSGTYDQ